jgi:hypothetical protein
MTTGNCFAPLAQSEKACTGRTQKNIAATIIALNTRFISPTLSTKSADYSAFVL